MFWKLLLAPPTVGGDARVQLTEPERRVLSKATAGAGGFLVATDFDDQITSARRTNAVISALAREIVTTSGTTLPSATATSHGAATWTSENAAYTASDDTFGQVSLAAYKAGVTVVVSEELAADAPGFDVYLADELGQRVAQLEETAFAVGDGSGKPMGIATAGNGVSAVTAANGSATGFKYADVLSVYAALPDGYRASASWLMSPTAYRSLAALTDSAGGLVLPSLQAAEPSLLGSRVYVSVDLPAAAANARSIVYGDIRTGYTGRRVTGFGVQRIDEIFSLNGQIGFRLFERVDGRVVLPDALRVLIHSAT